MSTQRIDKIISSQGAYSRSEVKKLIRSGQVSVNGAVVKDTSAKADTLGDEIYVCGKALCYSEFVYIMLNKPAGVVSASKSPGEKTVVDLVPSDMKRDGIFPAGRLDKDTTGFVLITDDGDFAHEILSPSKHVEKTYIALLDERIDEAELEKFRSGVTLADGYECLPAEIKELTADGLKVEIKLREGKYHQIKRMAAACGSHVVALRRTKIGCVALDVALEPGECRLLNDEEVESLRNG